MAYETFETTVGEHGEQCRFCGCALIAESHVCPDRASRLERQAAYKAAGWDVGQNEQCHLWASRPGEVRWLSRPASSWRL